MRVRACAPGIRARPNQLQARDPTMFVEACDLFQRVFEVAQSRARPTTVQVRDLMMFIEAQRVVAAEGGGELAGATVLPVPEPPQQQQRGGRAARRGKR